MSDREQINTSLRILVVDDDRHIRTIACAMLKRAGYAKVSSTDDPLNAIRRMQRGLVDIAFLDWSLPTMSGIEVLRSIRANDDELPIIMFTAHSDREHVMAAFKAGATDYISKPFNQSTLIGKLSEVLEKQKQKKGQQDQIG